MESDTRPRLNVIDFKPQPKDPEKSVSQWLRETADKCQELEEKGWNLRGVVILDTWTDDATSIRVAGYPISDGIELVGVMQFGIANTVARGPR